MSEDKRNVHTDALETLGMIIDETAKRDAIHLAVEPVIAKQPLAPGQHVTVDGRACNEWSDLAVGIVDPFLNENVNRGERFWLVVYPRQITSLRHVWEHPKFPFSETKITEEEIEKTNSDKPVNLAIEKSKIWIKELINGWLEEIEDRSHGGEYYWTDKKLLTYDNIMTHADYWVTSKELYPERIYLGNFDTSVPPEFWYHYEIVRGKKVKEDKKDNFFSCVC